VKYKRKNWPILVKNASLVPISNPDELKTKIEAEADHLRYNLRCSYTRQGIKPYVYEKQRGKLVVNILCGKPSFWKGWQMRDDDIGMWLEKTAGLIKGVYALFSAKTALS
ncbi:MAG: hypothetical protein Q8P35_02660, partial [Candidatus Yanofskybacteria bacterium]|nr:hypothetical protein [Candidatus Yanofskybacteria bacterium]